ncbi:cysteine--tRNA ligase [Bdellovibrionota bacterium FG-1]
MNTVIRPIKLTNTLTGKKELFEPREPGKVSLYSCGPTVYNYIHIGNLRGGLVADLFYRYFKRVGYDVNYVRNYTDVDDKIIKRANEEGISAEAVSKKYIQEVEKDYAASGMLEPTHKPTVTDHMVEIIALIERLIANGHAYVIESGEVLYSIEKFDGYGKLSHKQPEDLVAGMRVDVNEKKKSPLDFALWKPAKPGEPAWESPWGKGRPGWHIECSAMSSRWIGDQIDVHHGGEDLIFPHHENEIAQSEGASGHAPFVRYWLHHAFLTLSKTKMSKSLGNVFTARDFLIKFSGEFARFLLLGVHYRSPIDFDDHVVEQTMTGLQRIYEAKAKAQQVAKQVRAHADLRAEGAWGAFLASSEKARTEIDECYANDFNTAGALAALFTLIREFNRTLAEPLGQATPAAVLGATELLRVIEDDIGGMIGIGRQDPTYALEDLARIKAERATAGGSTLPTEAEILQGIEDRKTARASKDFAKADQIRKDLEARGVLLKDGPQGTSWSYK